MIRLFPFSTLSRAYSSARRTSLSVREGERSAKTTKGGFELEDEPGEPLVLEDVVLRKGVPRRSGSFLFQDPFFLVGLMTGEEGAGGRTVELLFPKKSAAQVAETASQGGARPLGDPDPAFGAEGHGLLLDDERFRGQDLHLPAEDGLEGFLGGVLFGALPGAPLALARDLSPSRTSTTNVFWWAGPFSVRVW